MTILFEADFDGVTGETLDTFTPQDGTITSPDQALSDFDITSGVMAFQTIDALATLNLAPNLDGQTSFTVDWSFKVTASGATATLAFFFDTDTGDNYSIWVSRDETVLVRLYVTNGDETLLIGGVATGADTGDTVAVSLVRSSGVFALYANDVLIGTSSASLVLTTGDTLLNLQYTSGEDPFETTLLRVSTGGVPPPVEPPPQVLSEESQSSGKRYFEIAIGSGAGVSYTGVFHDGATFPADDPLNTDGVMYWKDGSDGVVEAGTTGGTVTGAALIPPNINKRIRFAFDIDAGKLYIAVGPVWIGGCDPTLGLNPVVTGLAVQDWRVYAAGDGVDGNTVTIATGTGTFAYEVPTGFEPWSESGTAEEIPLSPVYTTALWAFVVGMAYAKNSTRQNLAKSNEFMQMFNTAVGLKGVKQREASPVVNTTGAQ